MKKAKLGKSNLLMTKIGLGTWAIGGPWQFGWGSQNDEDSEKAIIETLENGINWLDTAPIYGCGHSEEVIGKVLKKTSFKPIIATKCGLLWNKKREKTSCLKAQSIIAECEASLKRLGVETIDLYQMHWPEPAEDIEEGYQAMAKCVKDGKVRYLGVSNFNIEQIKTVMQIHPVVSLQPQYNMFVRDIEKEIIDFCGQNNIGILSYSSIARGLLTGKFNVETRNSLPKDDARRVSDNFQSPLFEKNLEVIEQLKIIVAQMNISVAQLAIAWVLRKKEITSAIVGARRAGQITQTAPAGDIELTNEITEQIEQILQIRNREIENG